MYSTVMNRLQDRRDAAADLGEDAGFTLIELMVVLLILAILLAIAIPTFLGVTGGANDRAAQSNLNTALTTAKSAETQNGQSYNVAGGGSTILSYSTLASNEPSITFTNVAVTGAGPVSAIVSTDGNGIILASFSKSTNTCWYAVDNIAPTANAANGAYTGALVGGLPGVGAGVGSPTQAPTNQGDFYGKQTGGTCTAAAVPTAATWGATFSAA
jgi:type IV pilus assembly protein PilA